MVDVGIKQQRKNVVVRQQHNVREIIQYMVLHHGYNMTEPEHDTDVWTWCERETEYMVARRGHNITEKIYGNVMWT
jgi:hypothetical protein